jgi:large subunit ribosomal protein L18
MSQTKLERRNRIRMRIRKKISGAAESPRLSVFRSNKEIYAQIIDDSSGHTIISASSRAMKDFKGNKIAQAKEVGKAISAAAAEKGIKKVVFDRSGYLYHGRVKSLADGAREGGLDF